VQHIDHLRAVHATAAAAAAADGTGRDGTAGRRSSGNQDAAAKGAAQRGDDAADAADERTQSDAQAIPISQMLLLLLLLRLPAALSSPAVCLLRRTICLRLSRRLVSTLRVRIVTLMLCVVCFCLRSAFLQWGPALGLLAAALLGLCSRGVRVRVFSFAIELSKTQSTGNKNS
jgi:hypothetical protein